MSDSIDDLIPNAKQIQKEAALKEAEKASEYARLAAAAEAEKRIQKDKINLPKRSIKGSYDDQAGLRGITVVEERY
jgi:hypothetical protein